MSTSNQPSNDRLFRARALEATIHVGLIVLLLYWCFKIGLPFIETIIWGIIIAVAIHPGHDRLKTALGGRGRLAATHLFLAASYVELGQEEEAQAEVAEILRISPDYRSGSKSWAPWKDQTVPKRIRAALRKAGLK